MAREGENISESEAKTAFNQDDAAREKAKGMTLVIRFVAFTA